MDDFYKGCGVYMRLLAQVACSENFLEMQKYMTMATAHRKHCQECAAINNPIENQLFGCQVVVGDPKEGEHARKALARDGE